MKKIWKGRNKKTENSENVGAVTHTHTHTHTQANLKENKTITHNVGAAKARKNIKKENLFSSFYTFTSAAWKICKANFTGSNVPVKMNNKLKRTRIIVPLIVVLMLISIIAVICVGAPFGRPSETAELNRDVEPNTEEILADTVTAGNGYSVNADGLYKIELHGGKSDLCGNRGSKVTGYMWLSNGDTLNTFRHEGGAIRADMSTSLEGIRYSDIFGSNLPLYGGDRNFFLFKWRFRGASWRCERWQGFGKLQILL